MTDEYRYEWRETLVVLVAVISGGSLTLVTSTSGVGASVPIVLDRGYRYR